MKKKHPNLVMHLLVSLNFVFWGFENDYGEKNHIFFC